MHARFEMHPRRSMASWCDLMHNAPYFIILHIQVVLAAVRAHGEALEFASLRLRSLPHVVLEACQRNSAAVSIWKCIHILVVACKFQPFHRKR